MRYRDEKFYWTYQRGVSWPDDYIAPDSMTHWIMEKSQGFTNVRLYKISESIRDYVYLILSLQASARSHIVGNMASALTAQKAFLNNFKDIINRMVDIQKDIKQYQDTLSYTSRKVIAWEKIIYMLTNDMNVNLKIRLGTVGYNNEILGADSRFSLGKNLKVNALAPEKKTPIVPKPTPIPKAANKEVLSVIIPEKERTALVLLLTSAFRIWHAFQ